ncbi:MAG TPA: ATP-dependent zinc metalloprotease FtsH [Pseudomonadales bacterium]
MNRTQSNEPKPSAETTGFNWTPRYTLWLVLLALLAYSYITQLQQQHLNIAYSTFKQEVREGHIAEVTITGSQVVGSYGGSYTANDDKNNSYSQFKTLLPEIDDKDLMPLLDEYGVVVKIESSELPALIRVILAVLPWVLIVGFFMYSGRIMRKRLGGGVGGMGIPGFGSETKEPFEHSKITVNYTDVAGLDNAKAELQEVVDFLKNPDKYRSLGAKLPKGVLLMGAPGTGKTLLARATAGEAGVPFFSVTGSEFIEMFVGVGASRVRKLFDSARKAAPALIFIDEIDSVGRARAFGYAMGNDERDQTLNQILAEMDGFSSAEPIVVLAATNRPDILDPALTRPGRFDRKVVLDLPQHKARVEILKVHTKKLPLVKDLNLDDIAAQTVGFSGADLANLANEAALRAARNNKHFIDKDDFDSARDRIVLGLSHGDLLNESEKERVAYHEAGHALTACLLSNTDPIKKISIIPRGQAMGFTEQRPEEDRHNLTEEYLQSRIAVLLGGRCAEELVFNSLSTGAANDLKQATQLVRQMITQWGMNKHLGPVNFDQGEDSHFLGRHMGELIDISEHTAEMIDDEIRLTMSNMEKSVIKGLANNIDKLHRIANALIDHETIEGEELKSLLSDA